MAAEFAVEESSGVVETEAVDNNNNNNNKLCQI